MELPRVLFSLSSKNEKNPPRKNSLFFTKWNFLVLILKSSYIFLYLLFQKWNPAFSSPSSKKKKKKKKKKSSQGNSLYSWIMKLSNCNMKNNILGNWYPQKNYYVLWNGNPEKIPYILGNKFQGTKEHDTFQETVLSNLEN